MKKLTEMKWWICRRPKQRSRRLKDDCFKFYRMIEKRWGLDDPRQQAGKFVRDMDMIKI